MKDTVIRYMVEVCKFTIVLNNKRYTMIDTNNDKFFFIFNDGTVKYGYTPQNSKRWDNYSLKKMKEILNETV